MPLKNKHDFCFEVVKHTYGEIIGFIEASNGKRHFSHDLAAEFSIPPAAMRKILFDLVGMEEIESAVRGKNRFYFIRTEAEKLAISRASKPRVLSEKIYRSSGPEWDRVREQLAEFRAIPSLHIERK